jgi:hypothetical protein
LYARSLEELGRGVARGRIQGSGQNFRKRDGDFVFVINVQGSSSGETFYVNLGAQPLFLPIEGSGEVEVDVKKIKENECVLRRRVGTDWRWTMSERQTASFVSNVLNEQAQFFGHAGTLPSAVASNSPRVLLDSFSWGVTEARAALHLARASAALGCDEKAVEAANLGLALAGQGASILRAELRSILQRVNTRAAQQGVAADGPASRS